MRTEPSAAVAKISGPAAWLSAVMGIGVDVGLGPDCVLGVDDIDGRLVLLAAHAW